MRRLQLVRPEPIGQRVYAEPERWRLAEIGCDDRGPRVNVRVSRSF